MLICVALFTSLCLVFIELPNRKPQQSSALMVGRSVDSEVSSLKKGVID